jgi:hypothetical protein
MLTLKVAQRPSTGESRWVDLTLEGDRTPTVITARFAFTVTAHENEALRWYLEDYLEYPADPAPAIAAATETRMTALGTELFRDHRRSRRGAPAMGAAPRPRSDTPIALSAQSFVRTHHNPSRRPVLPDPQPGQQLRVLLVICRPGGPSDVPFRSVAAHLARHTTSAALDLDVLRPPTWPALVSILSAAHQTGRPYHVVHFDGHGTYSDLTTPDYGDTGDGDGSGTEKSGSHGVNPSTPTDTPPSPRRGRDATATWPSRTRPTPTTPPTSTDPPSATCWPPPTSPSSSSTPANPPKQKPRPPPTTTRR